jgi:hypothetical protein
MSKLRGDPGYRAGWCIHYAYDPRGDNTRCEAGVEYAKFPKFAQRPCFLEGGKSKSGALPCEHLRLPTPEEIVAHEEWAAKRREMLIQGMVAVMPLREKFKGTGGHEVIECPVCKGKLHVSIMRSNGHAHVVCETVSCIAWVE